MLNPKDPASIGVNYSVWHRRFGKNLEPTDIGPTHQAELNDLKKRMEAIREGVNAADHGCNEITPWIALASGYRRQTDKYHEWSHDWNYDLIYSWTLGLELHSRWHGVDERAERFAPWNRAKIAIFYPEPFGRSPHWGEHFVAYVRGANGIKKLPLRFGDE